MIGAAASTNGSRYQLGGQRHVSASDDLSWEGHPSWCGHWHSGVVSERTGKVDLAAYVDELRERNERGECFICDLVQHGHQQGHIVFEDEVAVAFLPRRLTMPGRVLLAPRQHRTEVVDDFTEAEYISLQRRVHRVGRAVTTAFETERLYIFSFGARDGVAHVHWHIAALPPGVPLMEQQHNAVMMEKGHLDLSASDMEIIAEKIRAALT